MANRGSSKTITLVFPARQSCGRIPCSTTRGAKGRERLITGLPHPPSWAASQFDRDVIERIQRTHQLVREHNWTEARFHHPATLGYHPDSQPAQLIQQAAADADEPTLFVPALTELVVLSDTVLLTAADKHTGTTIETSALPATQLEIMLEDSSHGDVIAIGDAPARLIDAHQSGLTCVGPRLRKP